MDAFRFYEITAATAAGTLSGRFVETAGALQPTPAASDLPLLDEWKIGDDLCGAEIRLSLRGEAHGRRLTPLNFDPAFRLIRLFNALAYFRSGLIAHGLEKVHFFRYADGLESCVTADILTNDERKNAFMEGYLGSFREFTLPHLATLAAIAGINPQATEEELRRSIREWYASAGAWTTRLAGFAHQAEHFLRIENGVEKSRLAVGDDCRLVREPHNPTDPNAVMVMHHSGRKLGYLRRTIAEFVAPLIDLGAVYRSKVCAFLPDEFKPEERVCLAVERLG